MQKKMHEILTASNQLNSVIEDMGERIHSNMKTKEK
jgi:hypothetical protein